LPSWWWRSAILKLAIEWHAVSEAHTENLPPLAVVVVNWNGRHDLEDCFRTLHDTGYPGLRIIMVDNGSEDDSIAWTEAHYPEVEIMPTGSNLRWAGGNNYALRRLRDESYPGHILLLNNDTLVPEGSLRRLVTALEEDPSAWAATPRICFASDPSRVWYDGGRVGHYTGWIKHHGIRQLAGKLPMDSRYVDYGTGCALLLAPGLCLRIGLLDEQYHFYGEDADFSLRITAAGGRIKHVPKSLVLHKVSSSVGRQSPRRAWLRSRSHVRLLKTHWPRHWWLPLVASQAVFLAGHSAWNLWIGKPDTAFAVWKGALDELVDRPYREELKTKPGDS
jgi:GT2 family glycosyltransferase